MQLHRLLADKTHGDAELVLGTGHGGAAFCRRRVELERGVITHGAGQLQLHLHVGHAVPQRLEAADHHAKLLARVHVLDGDGQGLVHHADGFGAGGGDADVGGMLQRCQAVQRDQCGRRVLEHHVGRTAAVLRAVAAGGNALGRALDQEQRDLALGLRRDDEGIGLVTGRYYVFGSCQRPSGAGCSRFCFTNIEPVAGGVLLRGKHHQRFAAGDFRQPGGLDIGGGVAGQHGAGDQGLGQRLEHDAATEFLHHDHAFDRAHAESAVILGNVEAGQAEFGQLAISLARETAGLGDAAAALEVITLGYPFAHCIAQLFLVVAEIKIHDVS